MKRNQNLQLPIGPPISSAEYFLMLGADLADPASFCSTQKRGRFFWHFGGWVANLGERVPLPFSRKEARSAS